MSAVFSHFARAERLPPGGKRFEIEANEAERRAIAEALGIVAVEALSVEIDVRALAADTVGVKGTLKAAVVQTDVVTLEPVAQSLVEEIDVVLSPAESPAGRRRRTEVDEEQLGDERDVYQNGQIDLGAIAVEHLALGLDPYPRAPDVEFSGHIEDDPSAEDSPFAKLKRLKRDQE